MKRFIYGFLSLLILFSGATIYYLFGPLGVYTPGNRPEPIMIIIEKGMGIKAISKRLTRANLAAHPLTVYGATFLRHHWGQLKAGEYEISPSASVAEIIDVLASGKGIIHQLTIPEGLTIHEIVEKIEAIPQLKGSIIKVPPEGHALPETYHYVYGEKKQDLLNRMRQALENTLALAWEKRQPNLPLKTPQEALILASIVEKETGIPEERPQVAAVFINRLQQGMKLQADPTVIYGLTLGKTKLTGPLLKSHLEQETPFNTYLIPSLPPSPIACPGKKAIEATLNPASTPNIYFVANGKGGHHFSATLSQHNTFVRQWRRQIQP